MLLAAQVVTNKPCCDHLGEPLELTMHQLANISDTWHLAYPLACKFELGSEHRFYQLYLVPHNNPLFKHGMAKVNLELQGGL